MSSVHKSHITYPASKANDGVYLPPADKDERNWVAHTAVGDVNPWWRVNLEKIHCVWAVNILNRGSRLFKIEEN